MIDQERVHNLANVLVQAAQLPGAPFIDVDDLESRLKFVAYAQAQSFLDDPSALLAALGIEDWDYAEDDSEDDGMPTEWEISGIGTMGMPL